MTEYDITEHLEPSRNCGPTDGWEGNDRVTITLPHWYGRTPKSFGVGYVGPDGQSRRVHQGPVVPGPYGFLFGLPVVIAAHADPKGTVRIDAQFGDVLVMRGQRFEIVKNDQYGEHPVLRLIATEVTA